MVKVEYVLPSKEAIQTFARNVCERLASVQGDDGFCDREVLEGLTEFLEISARVQVKHFNRQSTHKL